MRKKAYLLGLSIIMAASMTGCGGSSDNTESSSASALQTEADDTQNASSDSSAGETTTAPAEYDENDGSSDGDDEEAENAKRYQLAEKVFEKTEQLLTALKAGDIETIIALGDPDDDVVEALRNISDSETAKKILQTIYADLCWTVTEQDLESFVYTLEELDGNGITDPDEEIGLHMETLSYRWMLDFDSKALLYFEPGDVVPEDFVPESEDQAWEILQTGLDHTPLQIMADLDISVPDAEGNFRFFYEENYLFETPLLDELDDWYEDEMVQKYVSELMDVGTELKIANTDAKYENDNDLLVKVVQYAQDKDFEALTDLLSDVVEKDYRGEYGSYDELTDAQKAYVDSAVEQMEVIWVDYSCFYGNGEEYRKGAVQICFPETGMSGSEEGDEFVKENHIVEDGGIYYLGSDIGDLGSSFLWPYYINIKNAKQNVE